jgi:hypothetical protein
MLAAIDRMKPRLLYFIFLITTLAIPSRLSGGLCVLHLLATAIDALDLPIPGANPTALLSWDLHLHPSS